MTRFHNTEKTAMTPQNSIDKPKKGKASMAEIKAKKKGRPSSFTQKTADLICDALASGKSLRSICSEPGMPNITTVSRWLGDDHNKSFRNQYARAREAQADAIFDEILEIADDTSFDTKVTSDGSEVCDHEWVARSRLRIDARKWMAGKLRPKKYGDKLEVDGTIGVGSIDEIIRKVIDA